jgi:hypothetical protein
MSASLTPRKSISDVRIAAAYSSGGSNPMSTRSGSSSKVGTPGMNEATTPTTTSTSGGDHPSRREAPATKATVTTIARTKRAGSTSARRVVVGQGRGVRGGLHPPSVATWRPC